MDTKSCTKLIWSCTYINIANLDQIIGLVIGAIIASWYINYLCRCLCCSWICLKIERLCSFSTVWLFFLFLFNCLNRMEFKDVLWLINGVLNRPASPFSLALCILSHDLRAPATGYECRLPRNAVGPEASNKLTASWAAHNMLAWPELPVQPTSAGRHISTCKHLGVGTYKIIHHFTSKPFPANASWLKLQKEREESEWVQPNRSGRFPLEVPLPCAFRKLVAYRLLHTLTYMICVTFTTVLVQQYVSVQKYVSNSV